MTKQEILSAIKECARKLGRAPTGIELIEMTSVTLHQIQRHFGRFNNALRLCRLKPLRKPRRAKMPDFLLDWAAIVRKLARVPTVPEYRTLGRHADSSLRSRLRSWDHVGRTFREYAQAHGLTQEWRDVLKIISAHVASPRQAALLRRPAKPRLMYDRPVYGPVMHACQLAHGPVNESGVLFLFGAMAERLGFVVMHIRQAFPDCEAMRRIDDDRCQRVWIEIKYESRNFLKHRHSIKGCDLIVCWKHNWPECPLEVIELSRYLPDMPGLPKGPVVAKKVRK